MNLSGLRQIGLAIAQKYGVRPQPVSQPKLSVTRTPEQRKAHRTAYWREWQRKKRKAKAEKKRREEAAKLAQMNGKRPMRKKKFVRLYRTATDFFEKAA